MRLWTASARYLALFFAAFLPWQNLNATTVIYCMTPTGIAIGSDGKFKFFGGIADTQGKMAILAGRFVLADIDLEHYQLGGRVLYDFHSWAKQVDRKIGFTLKTKDVAELVTKEARAAFRFMNSPAYVGLLGHDSFVGYIVAGCDSGTNAVFSIHVTYDRKHNGLQVENAHELPDSLGGQGGQAAYREFVNAKSNTRRIFRAEFPAEAQALDFNKPLTLEQGRTVVREIIKLETKLNSDNVGFPIYVITIPANGRLDTRTYNGP